MKRTHMLTTPHLPDGEYRTVGVLRWHEKLRLKLAKYLFISVPKPYDMEIRTTTDAIVQECRKVYWDGR